MKPVLTLFLLLAAFACGFGLNGNQDTKQEGKPVPFTALDPKRSGPRQPLTTSSGIVKPMRVVIRDREAWLELWKEFSGREPKPAPAPEIDFSREMLIVVAMGQTSSGGFMIMVDGVYERDNKLEVVVKSTGPGANCMTTQALTEPVDIVRLRKSDHQVVFRETSITNDCGL